MNINSILDFQGTQREEFLTNYILHQEGLNLIDWVNIAIENQGTKIEFKVASDYLQVKFIEQTLRIPLMPKTAQVIVNSLDCILPTKRMVDLIYQHSKIKLNPIPISPKPGEPGRASTKTFILHHQKIENQLKEKTSVLVAGHKKDIVITNQLITHPGKVAIYGWHQLNGIPIQPLYLGHGDFYVDYSHGIRPVHTECQVNGITRNIKEVLQDEKLGPLLTGSVPLKKLSY